MPRYLFVTGKLAEPALRRTLATVAPAAGFDAEVAVLPITVAALLTTDWVARHLKLANFFDRIFLPGYCRGELTCFGSGAPVERGPKDLRDLPDYFLGQGREPSVNLEAFDIEILAEINNAPQLTRAQLLAQAHRYLQSGADVIDLGCEPGFSWPGVGDATRALRDAGARVSIDSFDPVEVSDAVAAGAELVLSVNETNVEHVPEWLALNPRLEVVAIPQAPSDLESLSRVIYRLSEQAIRFRLDPIIEPIGFGFAASLGRYIDVRRRFPDAEIMMGIGNLTELTDVDSAGINVLLAGFCQELGVRSVLTTEVINWCRSSVKEFDLARRLVFHAVKQRLLPKHLQPDLIMLRDPKQHELGEEGLRDLAQRVTDRNYRLFVERGEIHILNGAIYLHGVDPFELFEQMQIHDPKLDLSHSFYLGYEMAKAVTALTLGKDYVQDQSLKWGFLTVPEIRHRNKPLS